MNKHEQLIRPEFLLLPTILLDNKNLGLREYLVFATIYWFERLKDGKCFASNKRIAEVINSTPLSVSNSLTKLEKEGFITRLYSDIKRKSRLGITCRVSLVSQTGITGWSNRVSLVGEQKYTSRIRKDNTDFSKISERQLRHIVQ